MMRVSICIPTYNQAQYLGDTLASAIAQNHRDLEIVVVDDASTDSTPRVIDDFQKGLPPEWRGRFRRFRNTRREAIGGATARAVGLAQGDYCVKVDSDDILEPDFVPVLLRGMLAHPDAGWAHCNALSIHPDGTPLSPVHWRKPDGYAAARDLVPLYLERSDTCHCVLLRKSAYDQVGGYRPEMLTLEDRLLWIEMIMRGYGCYYSSKSLAKIRRYGDRRRNSDRNRELVESLRFMEQRVASTWNTECEASLKLSQLQAIDILRHSLARTCFMAAIGEPCATSRIQLFDASTRFVNTFYVRLANRFWRAIPPRQAIAGYRVLGWPRRMVRRWLVKMKKMQAERGN